MIKVVKFSRSLIFVGLAGLIYLGTKYLTIQTIKCQVDDSACPPDVFAELSRSYGQNVYKVSPPELEEKLLKADFRLKSVKVGLRFPLTLAAELKTRIPVVQIVASKNLFKGLLVDAQGRIVAEREVAGLPLIIWSEISSFLPGQDLPRDLVLAIPTVNEIYSLFSPDSVEILNETIIFYLSEKTKVKYPLAGPADKLVSLQLWMNQARIKNQPAPSEIDLRFNYPVIKN
ncbi:hypothetical protein HYU89_03715 [Candidatus Collierbacteria bacterium]|nr:hypothetical protein [Candidatus Collierbacteria bacterium]